MTTTNEESSTEEEQALIELGALLITRYLQIEEHWTRNQRPASQRLALLERLENVLASFLDRSSPFSVTLADFFRDPSQSCYIEFNAPPQTAIRIEATLSALFATAPTPYTFERYLGAATDCFRLTKSRPYETHTSHKPESGLSNETIEPISQNRSDLTKNVEKSLS